MAAVLVIVSLTVVWTLPASGQWVNDFDQEARFECNDRTTLYSIRSLNSDFFEDRIWQFRCWPSKIITSCFWTEPLNYWDQKLDYRCPGHNFINGVYSVHDNYYEDRRFSVKCCASGWRTLENCYLTEYVNDWDGEMNFQIPGGYVIKGVESIHDNSKEDRRWKFYLCWIQ